jgi:hypothetical protein
MAVQYVANSLVGIDLHNEGELPQTAWYEKGDVIEPAHAEHIAEKDLKTMLNNGSLVAQNIRDRTTQEPETDGDE